ncbi:MAG: hypothetical protein E6J83_06220 [Deltaproteobacteria bacterium]|nr:MAG: hypothetical protein E6J83_06220 [Deltaproteobacteria bacterium]
MNTLGFLAIPAEIVPEQEAVVSEGRRFTYAETLARVRRLASALAHLGVGRGTRVAALHTNSHRYVEAYYAVAMLGAVFIPLNYRAKRPELEHMLRAGGAEVVLVGARYLEHLEALRGGLPELRTIIGLDGPSGRFPGYEDLVAAAVEHPAETEVQDDDVTILMYTSGTTALPKGVMLTFGDFTAYVTANVELADGTPRGAALRRDLSSLEILSYGGAAMPFPVIRRAIERFPKSVGFVNAFGQTETTSTLTLLGPEDHRLEGTPAEVERRTRRLGSIGRPLPDVEVRVVDENGRALGPGEVGEIWVRTPRVMKGYAGAGASPLRDDGWLPTRDMGWMDEDGYLYVAGRKDDMIIRGGENIAPAEVEAVLQSHPSVEEAAVVGVPDVEWGQRVAAFVVLRPGESLSPEALTDFCRERLASFKKPEVVHFVAELPKNPMGKILRKDLRAELGAA